MSGLRSPLSILAVALLLRLPGISTRPLWYDEAFSVLFSEKGPLAMAAGTLTLVEGTAADVHPLGYYSLLWGWMKLVGQSPLAVRSLSVLIGLGVVAMAYVLAAAMFGRKVAYPLALLVAIAPFQIHYAQETRMYGLLTLFLLIATWAVQRGLATRRWIWWALFSLTAALAQYTHNLAAFFLIPLALSPVFQRDRRGVGQMFIAGLGALLLYLPWLVNLPSQFAKVNQAYWTSSPGPARLVTTLLTFVTNLPLPSSWLPAALFISLLVLAIAFLQTWRAWKTGLPQVRNGLWMAYLSFAPVALLFVVSLWQPVYIERALLPAGVVFMLWLGWALFDTGMPAQVRTVVVALLLVAMAGGIYQHITYRGFPYAPFQELDVRLSEGASVGARIVHSNKLTMLPAVYYDRGLNQSFLADPIGSGSDTLAMPTQDVLGLWAEETPAEAAGGAGKVWFVIFSRAEAEYLNLGFDQHPHLAWLQANYRLDGVETWGDVLVYRFKS